MQDHKKIVFISSFSLLMLELLLSRIASFHLGRNSSYIAIPITLLGLALGSLFVHIKKNFISRFDVRKNLITILVVQTVLLLLMFFIYKKYFVIVGVYQLNRFFQQNAVKTAIFIVFMTIPFFFYGRLLSAIYYLNRKSIGRLYGFDLFGAATAATVTPILLHYITLETVLALQTSVLILALVSLKKNSDVLKLFGIIAVIILSLNFAYLNLNRNLEYEVGLNGDEVAVGWNEFSRVALIRSINSKGKETGFKIIHDNAHSNVHVRRYRENLTRKPNKLVALQSPFIIGRDIKKVLVMFAGSGAEMMQFNELSNHNAEIWGVEINPMVKTLALSDNLSHYNLEKFYNLSNINLEIAEGRSYMEKDTNRYDVIYVGTKASLMSYLTEHSRKFLDTRQALALYLDLLEDDGLLIFDQQPVSHTVSTLNELFIERGLGEIKDKALLIKNPGQSADLVVSPRGFNKSEIEKLKGFSKTTQIKHPIKVGKSIVVTDDRPFVEKVDYKGYTPTINYKKARNYQFFKNWIKITTAIAVIVLSVIFIFLSYLKKSSRPPVICLAYLLLTGFSYLVMEIAIMSKLELFLQNPLISMSTTLSIFLISSGIGSSSYDRLKRRINPILLCIISATSCVILITFVNIASIHYMGLNILIKIIISAILISPVGFILGLFYPHIVTRLSKKERENVIPVTYGFSTLSSVIGATYAQLIMINVGYTNLVYQASTAYIVLAVILFGYIKITKDRLI